MKKKIPRPNARKPGYSSAKAGTPSVGPTTPYRAVRGASAAKPGDNTLAMREMALTDFVTDPQARSVVWHYHNPDRPYKDTVVEGVFKEWAVRGDWHKKRKEFFISAERAVLDRLKEHYVSTRLADLETFESLAQAMAKCLAPLKNKDGSVMLHEKTGLPVFGLEMPPLDRMAKAFLAVHERVLLLRGDATSRTEHLPAPEPGEAKTASGLSPGDIRDLSRALLARRDADSKAIDTIGESHAEAGPHGQEVRTRKALRRPTPLGGGS